MKLLRLLAGLMSPALIAAAALAIAVAITALPAHAETRVMLRDTIAVTGEVVTLGDIFVNAGDAAGEPVARAPAPGTRAAISANHVAAAARAEGLLWPNRTRAEHLIVNRIGSEVPADAMAESLSGAIANATARLGARFRIVFDADPAPLFVAMGEPQTVNVSELSVDARSGTFQARINADGYDARRIRVSGRAIEIRRVPVPDIAISRNTVIKEEDLGWVEMEVDRIAPGIATDPADLVGMTSRNNLRRGQTVRLADLRLPVAVPKDSLVTITYKVPGMTLTARGRAMANGALDEVITVMNTRSRRTVEARVMAPGEVAVESMGAMQLAENTGN